MREQLRRGTGEHTVNRRNIVRGILLVAVVLTLMWLFKVVDVRPAVRALLGRVQGLGPWAPLWFILIYAFGCLVMFPGIILLLSGGVLFGVVKGTLCAATGATIGAFIAFLASRHWLREWVEKKWGSSPRFIALDQAVAREGWKIVGLIRLSPVFPFTPMNLLFGLTRIPLLQFVLVTWISVFPLTVIFVYAGTLIGDLAQITTRPVQTGNLKWVLAGIGLISTVVVTILVTRIARRALAPSSPEA